MPTTYSRPTLLALCAILASCAGTSSQKYVPIEQAQASLPQNSADCLAKKLKPADPLLASAIPEDVLRKAQSGWVVMQYDVVAGLPQNIVVAGSSPAGLYDAYALQHASRYRDPNGGSARGCVMTINIKF